MEGATLVFLLTYFMYVVAENITIIETAIFPHMPVSNLTADCWRCEEQPEVETYRLTNCAIWCKTVDCDMFFVTDNMCITCEQDVTSASSTLHAHMPLHPEVMYGEYFLCHKCKKTSIWKFDVIYTTLIDLNIVLFVIRIQCVEECFMQLSICCH